MPSHRTQVRQQPAHQPGVLQSALKFGCDRVLSPVWNRGGRIVKKCSATNLKALRALWPVGKRILLATVKGFGAGFQTESVREVDKRISFRGFVPDDVMQADPLTRQISMYSIAASKFLGEKANDVKGCPPEEFLKAYIEVCKQAKTLQGRLAMHKQNLLSLTTVSRGHAAALSSEYKASAATGNQGCSPSTSLTGSDEAGPSQQKEWGLTSQTVSAAERALYTCLICHEILQDPMSLQCLHSFCAICLETLRINNSRTPATQLPCPNCRQNSLTIQKNYFVKRLIDIQQQNNRLEVPELKDRPNSLSKYYAKKLEEEWSETTVSEETYTRPEHISDSDSEADDDYYITPAPLTGGSLVSNLRTAYRIAENPYSREAIGRRS